MKTKKLTVKLTVTQIKKKLDTAFSLWIRTRGSTDGHNRCYTCGTRKAIKELQCGHYGSRSALSTRWDPDNARPQCVGCNIFKHGNMVEYAYLLDAETPGTTARLRRLGRQIKKWGYQELLDLLESFKKLS